MSGEIQGEEIYKCKGKTIKDVIAGDPLGYNVSFTMMFTDDTTLEVTAFALAPIRDGIEGRLRFKEGKKRRGRD